MMLATQDSTEIHPDLSATLQPYPIGLIWQHLPPRSGRLNLSDLEREAFLETLKGSSAVDVGLENSGALQWPARNKEPHPPTTAQQQHRGREQVWRANHASVLRDLEGQWVVLEGEEIVAHGIDPKKLVEKARGRGIKSPYIFYVEPSTEGVVRIGL